MNTGSPDLQRNGGFPVVHQNHSRNQESTKKSVVFVYAGIHPHTSIYLLGLHGTQACFRHGLKYVFRITQGPDIDFGLGAAMGSGSGAAMNSGIGSGAVWLWICFC